MGVERTYGPSDILLWEGNLKEAMAEYRAGLDRWAASDGALGNEPSMSSLRRAKLTVSMLRCGLHVRHGKDGIYLDEKVVLAVNVSKWRRCGTGGWSPYRTIGQVVAEVRGWKPARDEMVPPPRDASAARLAELQEAMGWAPGTVMLPPEPTAAWAVVGEMEQEYARRKASGGLPANRQQMELVEKFAQRLGLDVPENPTMAEAGRLISDNARRYMSLTNGRLAEGPAPAQPAQKSTEPVPPVADRGGDPAGTVPVPDGTVPGTGTPPQDSVLVPGKYRADMPVIDFVADNLDILPPRQALALGRRFYATRPWEGFDALAEELGVKPHTARQTLDKAYSAFGEATGCWDVIRRELLDGPLMPPATLGDIDGQAWHAGLPEDALLFVAAKAAGIRVVEIEGLGRYLAESDDETAAKIARSAQRWAASVRKGNPNLACLSFLAGRFSERGSRILNGALRKFEDVRRRAA